VVGLPTPLGNTIYTRIKAPWRFKNVKGRTHGNWLYDERALLWFVDYLDFRYRHDLKTHILGTGDLGSGKSTFSQILYRLYMWKTQHDTRFHQMIHMPGYVDMIRDMLAEQPLDISDCCFELKDLMPPQPPHQRPDPPQTEELQAYLLHPGRIW